jgi:hypothetical protein
VLLEVKGDDFYLTKHRSIAASESECIDRSIDTSRKLEIRENLNGITTRAGVVPTKGVLCIDVFSLRLFLSYTQKTTKK